jgi:hypothetical protein
LQGLSTPGFQTLGFSLQAVFGHQSGPILVPEAFIVKVGDTLADT